MVCFYDTTYTSQVDNAFSESKSSYSRKDRNKVHLQEFYIRMCSSAGVRRTRSRHRLQLETQLHQFERIRARAEKLKAKITIIFIQHFLCGEKSNSRSRSQWKQRPLKFHLSLSRPMPQWNWLHVYIVSAACRMQVSSFFMCRSCHSSCLCAEIMQKQRERRAFPWERRVLCSKSRRSSQSAGPLYLLFGINCQKHAHAGIRHHGLGDSFKMSKLLPQPFDLNFLPVAIKRKNDWVRICQVHMARVSCSAPRSL